MMIETAMSANTSNASSLRVNRNSSSLDVIRQLEKLRKETLDRKYRSRWMYAAVALLSCSTLAVLTIELEFWQVSLDLKIVLCALPSLMSGIGLMFSFVTDSSVVSRNLDKIDQALCENRGSSDLLDRL